MALTPVDSLVGAYRLLQLRSGWPFQPIGQNTRLLDTLQVRTPEQRLAMRLFKGEADWQTTNTEARALYLSTGRVPAALRAARAELAEMPYSPAGYLTVASTYVEAQRFGEAIPYLHASIERGATTQAEGLLGSVYLQQKDYARAEPHLKRAIALDGTNQQALYNLAGLYAVQNRFAESLPLLDRVLRLNPNRPDALALRAQVAPLAGARTPVPGSELVRP